MYILVLTFSHFTICSQYLSVHSILIVIRLWVYRLPKGTNLIFALLCRVKSGTITVQARLSTCRTPIGPGLRCTSLFQNAWKSKHIKATESVGDNVTRPAWIDAEVGFDLVRKLDGKRGSGKVANRRKISVQKGKLPAIQQSRENYHKKRKNVVNNYLQWRQNTAAALML